LKTLHKMLKNKKKMNLRYAVVGFGGAGIAEEAHIKSIGKDAFGNLNNVISVLKTMKFDGKVEHTNDAFMAISEAASLPFRAGASKLFVLVNANKHTAHALGASLDEAKYALSKEVEGTLIVFNDVNFKTKRGGKVFAQSTRRIYTNKQAISGKFDLPTSEYKQFVEDTEGGYFDKNIRYELPAAKAAYEIASQKIKENNEHCKLCKVINSSLGGIAKAVCQSRKGMRCN